MVYSPETYQKNKEKNSYYMKRYYDNKEYIHCKVCSIYKTKRNTDMRRHMTSKHDN